MSGFGGNYNNNNHGGGRGRGGRGRGRGRGGGRGRSGRGNQDGGHGGENIAGSAKFRPCSEWTKTGVCNKPKCNFAKVVKVYAAMDASSPVQQNQNNYNNNYNNHHNNNKMEAVSAVAIWENAGQPLKIFTGSYDGYWRLWNTQGGNFVKEFEQKMGGKVECLKVAYNFLFCGFESISLKLPNVMVGMVHAWNLQNPTAPPMEFMIHPSHLPYAHGQAVTDILIVGAGDPNKEQPTKPPLVVSGSRDGSIRVWKYDNTGNFVLHKNLLGHAREVTGLCNVAGGNLLWSSGVDTAIRIWDFDKNAAAAGPSIAKPGDICSCQHAITSAPQNGANPSSPSPETGGPGHTGAVTSLLSFQHSNNPFVLSSSLDGTIKAWNGSNGECVASEKNGEGVVTMCLSVDMSGKQVLLVGLESGNIFVRNLLQTPTTPAFCLLLCLSSRYSAAHTGPVKALSTGPAGTFYSGGGDGKLLIWQWTNELGL